VVISLLASFFENHVSMISPLGLHRTTLTAALCRLSVARNSARGGRREGALDEDVGFEPSEILGCISHNYLIRQGETD
jgi:hypothetical protein